MGAATEISRQELLNLLDEKENSVIYTTSEIPCLKQAVTVKEAPHQCQWGHPEGYIMMGLLMDCSKSSIKSTAIQSHEVSLLLQH